MSGLFGAGNKVAKTAPEASSLRVTTACYGRPIPIGWGRFKVAAFVLWYGDFKAIAHEQSQGGKGGDSYTSVNYTYEAAVVAGICEGPINDVTATWKDKEYYPATTTSSKTYRKTEIIRVPFTGIVTLNPPAAITTFLRAYVPWTFNRDMAGAEFTSPTDFTRSGNTITFTNSNAFGINVNFTYEYTVTTSDSPMSKVGLSLLKGTYPQGVWSYLSTNHAAEAIPYSGIAIAVAPSYQLGASPAFPNTSFEVDSGFGYSTTIRDVSPGDFIPDYLCNPFYGAYFPSDLLGDLSDYSTYCIASGLLLSPDYTEQAQAAETLARIAAVTNSDWTLSDGKLKLVPYADQAVTGNGKTWTPNLTAQYALGPDDFVASPGEEPIRIKRKDPSERYNYLRVKFRSRDTQYNDDVAEGKDEAEIGRNGLRPAPYEQDVPEVKVRATAKTIADLLVQRCVNICNTYEFTLKRNKCGLEPMDLLTLTHPDYQLSGQLVRITKIVERESRELDIEAEEVPVGAASNVAYPTETPSGYAANYNVSPGNAETPVIFELPYDVTGSLLSVGVAATGLGTDWGGCEVWVSVDGTTYEQWGEIRGGSRYGFLTTTMPGSSAGVQIKSGQLLSASSAGLSARATLCYVGGSSPEFFAYQTATLTGTLQYTLSGISRGLYAATPAAPHSISDQFVRVDDAVAMSSALDPILVGKTIYVKLLSFNKYGGGKQTLADVSPTAYTLSGSFFKSSLLRNNYDFTDGIDGWTNVSSLGTGSASASGGTYGITSSTGLIYPRAVPIDPSHRYRVTVRVLASGVSVSGVYLGVVGFDQAGSIITNSLGYSNPYCVAAGITVPNDGQWHTYSGEISGVFAVPAASTPLDKFWSATVKASPLVYVPGGMGGGNLFIDYAVIEDVTGAYSTSTDVAWVEYGTTVATTPHVVTGNRIRAPLGGAFTSCAKTKNAFSAGWRFAFRYQSASAYFTAGVTSNGAGGAITAENYSLIQRGDGALKVRESATEGATLTASPGDLISIEFDGSKVRYCVNGAVQQTTASATSFGAYATVSIVDATYEIYDLAFTFLSSNAWLDVGGAAKPSDYASADLTMVNDGNCVQSGNRVTKVADVNGWNAGAHTRNAYAGGAYVSCYITPGMSAGLPVFMFGLNDNPTTPSYTDLNFAFAIGVNGANQVDVYEEGTNTVFNLTSFADGDHFEITYDGYTARWYKNGTLLRSVNTINSNPFFGDLSIWRTGTYVDRISFGPLSMVAGLQTGQISQGATYSGSANNYAVSGGVIASGATSYSSGAQSLGSFVASGAARIVEQAVFTMSLIFGAAVVSYVEVQLSVTRDDGVGTIHSIVGYFPCVPSSSGTKCSLVLPAMYRDASVPAAGTKNYTVSLTVNFFDSAGASIAAGLGASITWSVRNISNEFKV